MEQFEYSSFVKELATGTFSSPRCPPETPYAREFEHRMEALLVNYEITDEVTFGQVAHGSHRRQAEGVGLPSNPGNCPARKIFLEASGSFGYDDDSCAMDKEIVPAPAKDNQRSSASGSPCSVDSGQGLSNHSDSSNSSRDGTKELRIEFNDFLAGLQAPEPCTAGGLQHADICHSTLARQNATGKEGRSDGRPMQMSWQQDTKDSLEEIGESSAAALDASTYISKRRAAGVATKRTYDEANP